MTADAREAQCPYPGLEAFTAENQHFFFGRRDDTQLLISNLYASALTVVYGSSGVGKTSVVLAGVVPEVEREGEAVILVHRTWQDAARARSLGDRMVQAVANKLRQPPIAADAPLDVLAERLAARWRRPLFLVFDQFEEYFLHNEPSDEPDSLDGELARLINRRDLAVNVMIVMREDSIAALDRFRHRIPTLLNNLYRLEHLTPHEARSAIEEPLAVLRERSAPGDHLPTAIEAGLAVAILDDLATLDPSTTTAGAVHDSTRVELPFLQVVLERVWLIECRARSAVCRKGTFTAAGGARGIVRQRIGESLNTLAPDDQRIVASVLRHLVTPSGAKIALTMADLAGYAGVGAEAVDTVVQRLVSSDARVLRRVAHPSQDAALTKYEIYHDALGAPLLAWRLAMDRRRDERDRKAKRRVRDSIAALVVLVLAAVGVATFLQRGKSRVEARELATIASGQLETDNGRALLLARESMNRNADENAGEVVLRRALFEPGERLQDTVSSRVTRLTVSPDGRYVVGTDPTGHVAMWTTDSLRRIVLPSFIRSARGASFDSSGRRLLLVDANRPVVLELDSVVKVSRLPGATGSAPTGRLLRDGRRALISYAGSGVIEWTRTDSSWSETARTPTGEGVAMELALSPDERWLAWVTSGAVALVDMRKRPWIVRRISFTGVRVSDILFASSDALALATGTTLVGVLNVGTLETKRNVSLSCAVSRITLSRGEAAGTCTGGGVVLFTLPFERSQARQGFEPPLLNRPGTFTDLSISSDGRFVAGVGVGDLAPTVWSILSRRESVRLRGHRGDVTALAFLPDSRHVISVGADSTIRKWEIVSAAQRFGDGEFMAGRARVALNDSVTRAGMVGPYGVQLWDIARGVAVVETSVPNGLAVVAVASHADRIATLNSEALVYEYSPGQASAAESWSAALGDAAVANDEQRSVLDDSSLLQYVGRGDTLVLAANRPPDSTESSGIVQLVRGSFRGAVLSRFGRTIQALSVNSSGTLAAVGLSDGRVHVRSLRGDSAQAELAPHAGSATAITFGPGGLLASGGTFGDVHLASPQRSARPNAGGLYQSAVTLGSHERGITRLAFDKSGAVLASGDEGGTTRLWSTSTQGELCALEGQHADFIRAITFAPSGRTVATADERGVALWFVDAASSSCRFGYRLADLESPTEAMRFAPDGSALVVVGRDGVIRRYLRAVWAPRDSLLALAGRRLRGRQLSPAEKARYTNPK